MRAGRLPVPIDEKKLSGTFRNDRIKTGIEFSILTVCPNPPEWLDLKAKRKFTDLSNLLISKQMLFESDLHLIAALAKEYSIYEMACTELKNKSKFVKKTQSGYNQQSPWVNIRSTALKNVKEIGSLFGLDPLSRSRFNVEPTEKEKNPFENL